jgi:hypothetical protein
MDEVEELWNVERKMKLQEKYRLITQRVLNPHANPYTGSMAILYSFRWSKFTKEELSFSKIQRSQKTCAFPFKKSKRFTMLKSLREEEERLSKEEKGNNELHPFWKEPSPSLYNKNLGLGFPKLGFWTKISKSH